MHEIRMCESSSAIGALPVVRIGRGFTTAELMIAVGIAAILTAIAVPALNTMVANQRLKTATFDLYSAMSYARSEAIKRNAVVSITPRAGGFAFGYDIRSGASIIKSQPANTALQITAPAGVLLEFDAYGRLTSASQYQIELSSSASTSALKRCVVVSPSGRPSIRVDNNKDGNCLNG